MEKRNCPTNLSVGSWNVITITEILLALPISEAENERTFSIIKHVVGARGGRSKNGLVTARVHLRLDSNQGT
jgi:hypothetical protein